MSILEIKSLNTCMISMELRIVTLGKKTNMINYICDSILLEDGSIFGKDVTISVPESDLSTAEDRYEHLVSITGVLETVIGSQVEKFSYSRL